MDFNKTQFSIVVLAKDHNPTILNPDFLTHREVVPEDWSLASPPITTPPFSSVRYGNGITITVETNKLQVTEEDSANPARSDISGVIERYIQTLPHVHYSAVGLNFRVMISIDDVNNFVKDRYLKQGPWDSSQNPLESVGFKFAYSLNPGQLVVSIDVGQVNLVAQENEPMNESKEMLLLGANFHRECAEYPSDKEAIKIIKGAAKDWKRFGSLMTDIVEG